MSREFDNRGDEYRQFLGSGLAGRSEFGTASFSTATVVSRTEADYLFLDAEAYNRIIHEHPRIAIKVVTKYRVADSKPF